jgi:hypothetical protein
MSLNCGHQRAYCSSPDDRLYEYGEPRWNDIDRGKLKASEKTSPSATLSTENPTWTDPAANPGLCGERPASNHLGHGVAIHGG